MLEKEGVQPPRQPSDGPIEVGWIDGNVRISGTTAGKEQSVVVSPFNAFRVVAGLAFLLGVKLSPKSAKNITL